MSARLKRVRIGTLWLNSGLETGKEHHARVLRGLPKGARFERCVEAVSDAGWPELWALFSPDDWPELKQGQEIPEAQVQLWSLADTIPYPLQEECDAA